MKRILLAGAAVLAMVASAPAMAHVDVGISIGIPLAIGVPGVIVAPAPVYYPPVRYVAPQPRVVVPAPVYVPAYRWRGRHYRSHNEWRGDRSYRRTRYWRHHDRDDD